MSDRKPWGPLSAGILLLGLIGCGDGDGGGSPDAASEAVEPQRAPSYEAVTLDGDPVSLSDLRGDVVLLNVWATWCAPCRQEIPELQSLYEEHSERGLRVVGVTVDTRSAAPQVRQFIDDFDMTYDVWWDPDQTVLSKFEAVGVPLTVLIDREGRIVWRHLGAFQRGDPELLRAVESSLGPVPEASSTSTD